MPRRSYRLLISLLVLSVSSAVAQAEQPPYPRTMLIVAHQDDDIPMLSPDLEQRVKSGTPMQTVYLTNGNAGLSCADYTRGREQGVKEVHALLAGVSNRWKDEERTINGKLLRFSTLVGTEHVLIFFGFPNAPEENTSLEYLWRERGARLSSMALDGRSRVDSYSAEELKQTLHALMVELAPEEVLMLDASQRQPEFYPFEHTDHVHSALFGLAALSRYGKARSFSMYRTYNIQLEPKNLTAEQIAHREDLFKLYATHDKKICEQKKVELCGERTRCFPIGIFLPFYARLYKIEQLTRRDSAIRTQFARCLHVSDGGVRVDMRRCRAGDAAQRWSLAGDGLVRHLASGRCLTAARPGLGSKLTTAVCRDEPLQHFFMTSAGQLRGPDASCVRSGLRAPVLTTCRLRSMRQAGFRLEDEPSNAAP